MNFLSRAGHLASILLARYSEWGFSARSRNCAPRLRIRHGFFRKILFRPEVLSIDRHLLGQRKESHRISASLAIGIADFHVGSYLLAAMD